MFSCCINWITKTWKLIDDLHQVIIVEEFFEETHLSFQLKKISNIVFEIIIQKQIILQVFSIKKDQLFLVFLLDVFTN